MKNICPLTGLPCPKKKLIHITDIAQNKAETKNLCLDCAADYVNQDSFEPKEEADKANELIEDFVKYLSLGELPKKKIVYPDKHCPNCRTSLEHIATKGKLGCSQCYITFGEELKPLLITAQAGLKHIGKVPEKWKDAQRDVGLDDRIMELEVKMQSSIVKERYEDAAECRDELSKLRPIWEKKKKLSLEMARAIAEGELQAAQAIKEEINALLANLNL